MRPRLRRARIRRVRIPLNVVYVSSMYLMDTTVRTIVELESADGWTGVGDAPGYPEVRSLIELLAHSWMGRDLRDRAALRHEFAPTVFHNRNGRNGWSALAGLETAVWDLMARRDGVSLSEALGGSHRSRVEVACPLSAAAVADAATAPDLAVLMADPSEAARVAEVAAAHATRDGFRCFKYKSAARNPAWDLAAMRALRERLGPDVALRFDPNAGYTVAEAVALGRELVDVKPEFLEDPAPDLDGLSAVRTATGLPTATNMFVISPEHVEPAGRARAVDVVLADVFLWGGIQGFADMVPRVVEHGMEPAIHSLFESGVGTAVNLHLAAALPSIQRANDSGLHLLGHSLCVDPPQVRNGAMEVPADSGNGIELDQDVMARMAIDEVVVRA